MLNDGKGYTDLGVDAMLYEEVAWHVKQLTARLKEEQQARERAVMQAQAKSQAAQARSRFKR